MHLASPTAKLDVQMTRSPLLVQGGPVGWKRVHARTTSPLGPQPAYTLTTTMNTLAEQLAPASQQHPHITRVIVFGSLTDGRARPDSEFDIAVQAAQPLTPEPKVTLIDDWALATGRPVDVIDLRTVDEPLLGQIRKHGKRVRGSDGAFARLVSKHLINSADFLPYVEWMLTEERSAWMR